MTMRLFAGIIIFSISCTAPAPGVNESNSHYQITKEIRVSNGAVVCAHPLASRVGVEILKKGGNAFDAAIATQFALAVVYPGAGNLGGGGFMVARTAKGELISLDFRESAPASSDKDMYLDDRRNVIPNASLRGPGAAGVPGTVAGCFEMLKYARFPVSELITPAVKLAREGFAITAGEAASLNNLQDEFARYNAHPTAFQKSESWKEGDQLLQPELAVTLERIKTDGLKGFYEGKTAELIVAEMRMAGGHITLEDLRNYRAKWREPHRFTYRNHEIITMGLPSSGGVILNQVLKMVEDRKLNTMSPLSPSAVQLVTEAERRAYADRADYLGDPDFIQVPVRQLTSDEYIRERMAGYQPGIAGKSDSVKAGEVHESEETTHLSIIDSAGNAVAITTTLNDSYGSKTVVTGAGFLLNNEMDDFSIKPGEPNLYGAIGGEANAIAPGKRMLSSMSPTIVLQQDKPLLILGTPGGTTIPTTVIQTIIDVIDFKLNAYEAVTLPRFHHQWLPDEIFVEDVFPDSTINNLRKMGYVVVKRGTIGRTELIQVLPDGKKHAVADVRGDDHAEGY